MAKRRKLLQGISVVFVVMVMMGCLLFVVASEGRDRGGWNLASGSNVRASASNIGIMQLNTEVSGMVDLEVTIKDGEGNLLEDYDEPLKLDMDIEIQFDFLLIDVAGGDKFYINLPEEVIFEFESDWILYIHDNEYCDHEQTRLITDNEYDNCKIVFQVTYDKSNHRFVVECNSWSEEVETWDVYFWIQGTFNQEIIEGAGGGETILVFGEGSHEIEVKLEFEEEVAIEITIDKNSTAVWFDREANRYVIQWQLRLNEDGAVISSIEIKDALDASLKYIDGTTEITYEGNTWSDSNLNPMDEWKIAYNDNIICWSFQASADESAIEGPFTILFQTTVEAFEGVEEAAGVYTFYNTASFISGEGEGEDTGSANIEPKILTKEQVDPTIVTTENQEIEWKITINEENWRVNNKTLMLYDELQENLELILESIVLKNVETDKSFTWDEIKDISGAGYFSVSDGYPSRYNEENDTDIMAYILAIPLGVLLEPDGLNETWELTYTTKVSDDFFQEHQEAQLINYAYLDADWDGWYPAKLPGVNKDASVVSDLIQKTGTAAIQNKDYQNAPTITWEIIINSNKLDYTGKNVSVEDKINSPKEGLETKDIKVYIEENDAWKEITSEVKIKDISMSGWKVIFPDGFGAERVKITFVSVVTNLQMLMNTSGSQYFYNQAELFVNDVSKGKASADPYLSRYTLSKAYAYDFETQNITWTVRANRNGLYLPGTTTISDTMPEGLQIITESFVFSPTNIISKEDLKFGYDSAGNAISFSVDIEDLSKEIKIIFDTEFTEEFIRAGGLAKNADTLEFMNNVTMINGSSQISASSTAKIKNTLVEKSGNVEGESILWIVNVNPLSWNWSWKSDSMAGLRLEDTGMNENLVLATDTIELYEAAASGTTSSSSGTPKLTEGNQIEIGPENIEYVVDDNGKTNFTFIFPDVPADRPYILKFYTDVLESGDYTNTIALKGFIEGSGTTTKQKVTISAAGGGATGNKRGIILQIEKADGADLDSVLPGAVFTLKNQLGISVEANTDENGVLYFGNLIRGQTYILAEKTTPTGFFQSIDDELYVIEANNCVVERINENPIEYQITVNADASASTNLVLKIENTKIVGDIEFRKLWHDTDNNRNQALAGAKFQLKDSSGNWYQEAVVSDKDGVVRFEDVEYGLYQIWEIQTPEGFWPISEMIDEVSVRNPGETVYLNGNKNQAFFINEKIQGDVEIKKISFNQEGKKVYLADAVFKLIRTDGFTAAEFKSEYEGKSGDDGVVAFSSVDYGTYELWEMEAPTGYQVRKDSLGTIRINEDGTVTYNLTGSPDKEIYNEIIHEDLLVIKTNASGTTRLSGAKFHLYQVSDVFGVFTEEVLLYEELITDVNGEILIENLEYGQYYLQETQAPTGYRLPVNTKTFFEITEENNVVEVKITNQRNSTGGGSETPTTAAPQPSTEETTTPEESTTMPTTTRGGGGGNPGTELPPGYTFEYDEETGLFMVIDPNGIPLGWFDSMEDIISAIPKTGDRAPVVILVILVIGAGGAIISLLSKKRFNKNG